MNTWPILDSEGIRALFGEKEILLAVANAAMADMTIKVPVNLKLQPRRHTDTHTDIFTFIHLMYLMIHFLCRKFKKKIIVSDKFFSNLTFIYFLLVLQLQIN